MPENRMKVAPDTVAYADSVNRKLIVEISRVVLSFPLPIPVITLIMFTGDHGITRE